MRVTTHILVALIVLGLGLWAYDQHYETRAALRKVESLQADIAKLREDLAIQRAEWAYLNRPDRLQKLAVVHFDSLGLLPMDLRQFGEIEEIPFKGFEKGDFMLPEQNTSVPSNALGAEVPGEGINR